MVEFSITKVEYEGWHEHNFNIEYKAVEKSKYTVVARLKFESQSEEGDVIMRMSNDSDPYFKNFSRIRVFPLANDIGHLDQDHHEEGILVKPNEKVFGSKDYFRFNHKPHERYLVNTCNPRSLLTSWASITSVKVP